MSDPVKIEIIKAAGQFLVGVPAIVGAWFAFRAARGVSQVKKQTDGMTSQLVALTAKSSEAEGNLKGRAELSEETKQQ